MEENKFFNKGGDAVNLGKTVLEFDRAVEETTASLGQAFLQSPSMVGAQQKAETTETDLSLFILKTKVVDKAWGSKNNILSQTHRGSATSNEQMFLKNIINKAHWKFKKEAKLETTRECHI